MEGSGGRHTDDDGGAGVRRSVVVVDDHPLMLEAVVAVIDSCDDFTVVGTAMSGRAAIAEAHRTAPDLMVVDQSMPDVSGVEVAEAAMAARADTRIVILSAHVDAATVTSALKAGVHGYLPKSAPAAELIGALRAVADGGVVLHPSIAAVVHQLAGDAPVAAPVLSTRESAVLDLLAAGKSNKAIARDLGVSAQTVKTYVERVYAKLGVSNRGSAVRRGFELGLLRS